MPLPCWDKPEGGRPPLAAGCGMGEGDCAGEGMRAAPLFAMAMGADGVCWGSVAGRLCDTLGESVMEPNWMLFLAPPTGPPFMLTPFGPIVMELLRL